MPDINKPLRDKRAFLAGFGGLSALLAAGNAVGATWQSVGASSGVPYVKEFIEVLHYDQGGNTPGSKLKITRGDGSIYYIYITLSTTVCNCNCDCCGG